jgi:hypothetical protein
VLPSLSTCSGRSESGRPGRPAPLQEAVAFEACLMVVALAWPEAWVRDVRGRREEVLAKIAHRRSR